MENEDSAFSLDLGVHNDEDVEKEVAKSPTGFSCKDSAFSSDTSSGRAEQDEEAESEVGGVETRYNAEEAKNAEVIPRAIRNWQRPKKLEDYDVRYV